MKCSTCSSPLRNNEYAEHGNCSWPCALKEAGMVEVEIDILDLQAVEDLEQYFKVDFPYPESKETSTSVIVVGEPDRIKAWLILNSYVDVDSSVYPELFEEDTNTVVSFDDKELEVLQLLAGSGPTFYDVLDSHGEDAVYDVLAKIGA
jgi:hypothetical protein